MAMPEGSANHCPDCATWRKVFAFLMEQQGLSRFVVRRDAFLDSATITVGNQPDGSIVIQLFDDASQVRQ